MLVVSNNHEHLIYDLAKCLGMNFSFYATIEVKCTADQPTCFIECVQSLAALEELIHLDILYT